MGRSILHRKVIQNRRRVLDPSADHLMAASHYNSDAYDDFVEVRDNPRTVEPVVQLRQSELAALMARIDKLENPPAPAPAAKPKRDADTSSDSQEQ